MAILLGSDNTARDDHNIEENKSDKSNLHQENDEGT